MPEVDPPAAPPPPPPKRSAFEWSLAALRPADADVARPSFMYKAGQASREKAVRFWRWVAGGCGTAAVGAVVTVFAFATSMLAVQRHPPEQRYVAPYPPPVSTTPEPPVYRPSPSAQPHPVVVATEDSPRPEAVAAALARRREVLVGGLGLLPDAKPVPAPSAEPLPLHTGVFAVPTTPKPTEPR